MTTKEKIDKTPFNSDYEEKLLLDELMLTPSNNEHMFSSHSVMFRRIHEKPYYDNICKKIAYAIYESNTRSFKQKLMGKNQVEGGKPCVC